MLWGQKSGLSNFSLPAWEGHTGHVLADGPFPSPTPQPIILGCCCLCCPPWAVAAGHVWSTPSLHACSLGLVFPALSVGEIRILSPSSLPRAKSAIINEAKRNPLWAGLWAPSALQLLPAPLIKTVFLLSHIFISGISISPSNSSYTHQGGCPQYVQNYLITP